MDASTVFDRLDWFSLLLRAGAQTRRDQNGGFRGRGRILGCLSYRGTLPQHELAAAVMMQPGSLTEALGRLERGGLVTRQRDSRDRRVTLVQLTDAGHAAWKQIAALRRDFADQLLADFSPAELTTLDQLVSKMTTNLKRAKMTSGKGSGD